MHKRITPRLIPALIALAFSGGAFASGFQLSEQSASGIGVANAGAAAAAEDFLERTRASWHGKQEPTDAAILAWFVDIFPFARTTERERLIEGLRKAGLPVPA